MRGDKGLILRRGNQPHELSVGRHVETAMWNRTGHVDFRRRLCPEVRRRADDEPWTLQHVNRRKLTVAMEVDDLPSVS